MYGDGRNELVAGLSSGDVYVIAGNEGVYSESLLGNVGGANDSQTITVADSNNNGRAEVIIARWSELIDIYEYNGSVFGHLLRSSTQSPPGPVPVFSWRMSDRYGLDSNNNGRIDMPNSKAYVNPASYTIRLDASSTMSPLAITSYKWTISGGGLSAPLGYTGQKISAKVPKLGKYTVKLDVVDSGGRKATTSQSVLVKDILIVQLGDSYASGEGNPEVPSSKPKSVRWADGVSDSMTRENFEAHRSILCASSQAALALERSDPHFSVTYINLAQSGATIAEGLLEGKDGSVTGTYKLPGQILELQRLLGFGKQYQRRIDFLSLSIGGNDIGFAGILQDLLGIPLPKSTTSILKGFQRKLKNLKQGDNSYESLAGVLSRQFNIPHTLITPYPDMTRDDEGFYMMFANDVVLPFQISVTESQFASRQILTPLNSAIAAAAKQYKWQCVNGFLKDFLTHGYGANVHWFRQMAEARAMQGNESTLIFQKTGVSSGGFHPNTYGLDDISKYLLSAIQSHMT